MSFPDFYARVPEIVLYDPLAELLGAADGGIVRYRYEDAVRLAGHSCPTVASAYLMAGALLARLYPGEIPVRGGLRVALRGAEDEGVVGVVAAVFSLVTGAAGCGGFKGLGGRFARRGRLTFGVAELGGEVRLTRDDSGAGYTASVDLASLPGDPVMAGQLGLILAGEAGQPTRADFAARWQGRVRTLLEGGFDQPRIRLTA